MAIMTFEHVLKKKTHKEKSIYMHYYDDDVVYAMLIPDDAYVD